MRKHANTYFPNQAVRVIDPTTKTASSELAHVIDADPTTGTVHVRLADGTSQSVPSDRLTTA